MIKPLLKHIPPGDFKAEVLLRLRWSLLGSATDIEIESGLNEDGTERYQPFLLDPVATENVTITPTSRLRVLRIDLSDTDDYHNEGREEDEQIEYEDLTIEIADGSPITYKDFVIKTHEYFSQHMDDLYKFKKETRIGEAVQPDVLAEVTPEGFDLARLAIDVPRSRDLFFDYVYSSGGRPAQIYIQTFMEGFLGKSAEAFFQARRRRAAETFAHGVKLVRLALYHSSACQIS